MTKDRIGAVVAAVVAVVGLVLVFHGRDADGDNAPGGAPPSSEVGPPSGEVQAPGSVENQAPAPTSKPADTDDDNDNN